MEIAHFQRLMSETYRDADDARGIPATVAWLAEEVGELAQAVRKGTHEQQVHEFGDVLAWVVSLANQTDVDLAAALQRFADGCPRCASIPCRC